MRRRTFLAAALSASFTGGAGRASSRASSREKVEPEGDTRDTLPTPALLLDLDLFEANLRTMAEHCRRQGCGFRPHAKTHKCPEIARRQVASGARGICVATVPEAEAMVAAGITGVLLTSPIVEPGKIARMVDLARSGGKILLAVGDARQIEMLSGAGERHGVTLDVLLDIDVGDRRTGVLPGAPALELARFVEKSRHLRLRGLQAYSGRSSHVVGFEARSKASREAMGKALETRDLLRAGHDVEILSGGSTGTYNIDSEAPGVTELQVGSYVFMDVGYRKIGSRTGSEVYTDFQPSLTVLTTVVSTTHGDHATVDAGIKAFATDSPHPPEARRREGISYRRFGDEFGALTAAPGTELPRLGDRLEFIVPHCDPTVNLYDRIHALRGDRVVEAWPIRARRSS